MKKLALLFAVVALATSCGPSKEKLDEAERAEMKQRMRHNDSTICFTFALADTALYK